MPPIITMEGLTKTYGRHRGVSNVNAEIAEGEVFGFLGPNGAGKTTTMRLLLGLLKAGSGRATIKGLDCWSQARAVKRFVGYLPGEFSFAGSMRGMHILTYLANLRGGVDTRFLASLIERFALDPSRRFDEYSRGNKQKVALIQAFMHRPAVVILDEPSSGLDPLNQQTFYQLVAEARANGQTVFLSSHILSEVEQTCQRVCILREGQVVTTGAVVDLKRMRHHKILLRFATPVSPDLFAGMEQVLESHILGTGQTIELIVQGDLQPIIQLAARQAAISINAQEPTLEEVFLHYYRQDATAPRGTTTRAALKAR
jgi:ABC-2 type transport system ATP-binding protein